MVIFIEVLLFVNMNSLHIKHFLNINLLVDIFEVFSNDFLRIPVGQCSKYMFTIIIDVLCTLKYCTTN